MREIGPHSLETYSVDEDSSDGEFEVEVADIITMEVFVENADVEQGSGQGLAVRVLGFGGINPHQLSFDL